MPEKHKLCAKAMLFCQRMAQKYCHLLYTSVKINTKGLQFVSVVNFECPNCYCSATEKYAFSCMPRVSPKWGGMVMCLLNKAEEVSVTKFHKWLQNVYGASTVDKRSVGP